MPKYHLSGLTLKDKNPGDLEGRFAVMIADHSVYIKQGTEVEILQFTTYNDTVRVRYGPDTDNVADVKANRLELLPVTKDELELHIAELNTKKENYIEGIDEMVAEVQEKLTFMEEEKIEKFDANAKDKFKVSTFMKKYDNAKAKNDGSAKEIVADNIL